jgi:hypothetical protein
MRFAILLALGLGACAGDEVDMGNGQVCSKALYDTCETEHDCISNQCINFASDGFQVCAQSCTDTVPCPDFDGVVVACSTDGLCKPPMARDCRVVL